MAVDDIDLGNRLRGIDPAYVQMLAESISRHGQMTPIEVRKLPPGAETPYVLVAGAHRIEAMRTLGKSEISVVVFDGDELSARLREIEENLARHDLTELDRAGFFAEKKAIYEALNPETKHGKNRREDKFVPTATPSFAQETARRLGYDDRSIKRFVLRHQRLTPGVRRSLTGTWLANHGQQLDQLGKLQPDEQASVVSLLLGDGEERPKKVAQALKRVRGVADLPSDRHAEAASKLLSQYLRLPAKQRRWVWSEIQKDNR